MQVFIRSSEIVVTSRTVVKCGQALTNVKNWTVYLINPSTGVVIKPITNVSSVQSSTNAMLALPPQFLAYGLYLFS